jgi:hypothetical protein
LGFIQDMSARWFRLLIFPLLFSFSISLRAAEDLDVAKRLMIGGKYETVIENAEAALKNQEREDEWRTLLMRAQLALGKYPEAYSVATNALRHYSSSIRMQLTMFCKPMARPLPPENCSTI